jgi:hypothetical protein
MNATVNDVMTSDLLAHPPARHTVPGPGPLF